VSDKVQGFRGGEKNALGRSVKKGQRTRTQKWMAEKEAAGRVKNLI